MKRFLAAAFAIVLSACAGGPFAPAPVQAQTVLAYSQDGHATLAVTTTTGNVALGTNFASPSASTSAIITNTGSADAYIALGGSGVTATTSGFLVQAGHWSWINIGSQTWIAAITASGSTTLDISTGRGMPAGGGGGSSGGAGGATNITQVGGAAIALGATTASGGIPIAFPTDQSLGVSGSVTVTDGTNGILYDPCQTVAKTTVAISQTANAKLISATTAKKNYICSITVNGADAEDLSIVEGTGSTCGTNTAAVLGGTTAANGMNFPAGGGFSLGSGAAAVAGGTGTALDLCLFQSGSGRVAGVITYVQR